MVGRGAGRGTARGGPGRPRSAWRSAWRASLKSTTTPCTTSRACSTCTFGPTTTPSNSPGRCARPSPSKPSPQRPETGCRVAGPFEVQVIGPIDCGRARLGQGAAASAFSPSASVLVARLNPTAKHGRAFGSYGFHKSIGYSAACWCGPEECGCWSRYWRYSAQRSPPGPCSPSRPHLRCPRPGRRCSTSPGASPIRPSWPDCGTGRGDRGPVGRSGFPVRHRLCDRAGRHRYRSGGVGARRLRRPSPAQSRARGSAGCLDWSADCSWPCATPCGGQPDSGCRPGCWRPRVRCSSPGCHSKPACT